MNEYNPLNIPDFDAGEYKGCPRKRRFIYLQLNPFLENEAIVVKYLEWIIMPSGETDLLVEKGYIENIESLREWFNYVSPQGASIGQVILGAINLKLNRIENV